MRDDIEPQAAAHVGQLVFAFARLDFLLALGLRNLLSCGSPEEVTPLIERLGFKDRLDSLREVVARSARLSAEAKAEFEAWHTRADKLRTTRNAFVHGRWGIQSEASVFNASTKVGKALTGDATIYSLQELEAEANRARQVLSEFYEWHFRNVVRAA